MIEIGLNHIVKYYGTHPVIRDATFELQSGERIGIVGGNGEGKTTILKIIAGIEDYEKGSLSVRKGASISYLQQIPAYNSEDTVQDILNSAFSKINAHRQKIEKVEQQMALEKDAALLDVLIRKYSDLMDEMESIGGYTIEEKMNKVSGGLKIDSQMKGRHFSSLSGGEKTIVMLAKCLLQMPDIILLDEPTNHLDLESLDWLEKFIRDYQGSVLIVSHDRYFLDKTVTKIVELDQGESDIYFGNYTAYIKEREQRLLQQFAEYQDQQKKIQAMEKTIRELREWGVNGDNEKFFRRAESIEKRLNKVEKLDKPEMEKKKMRLDLSIQERSGKEVVRVKNLGKSYDGKQLFQKADWLISYKEKTAILGENGCGKSTFLKCLLGFVKQDTGEVSIGSNVKIGYMEQEIAFADPQMTILDEFQKIFRGPEDRARARLAGFLFFKNDVFKKIKDLSGGELARFRLCQLMHQDYNLLVFDEPTNHLDINAREVLEEALLDFDGTLLFISHDRYFINKIADRVLEMENASLQNYLGNYDAYREEKERMARQ